MRRGRDISARLGGSIGAKAGWTEVRSREVSSGNVEQDQELEVKEVLQVKAISSNQQGQTLGPEMHDRSVIYSTRAQVNRREDTGHQH